MNTLKIYKKTLLFLLLILFSNNAIASESLKKLDLIIPFPNLAILNSKEKPFIFDFEKNTTSVGYVINFWATWCVPCKKEMPSLDKLYQDSRFKNLEILAVNMEQPNQLKTKKFFSDLDLFVLLYQTT